MSKVSCEAAESARGAICEWRGLNEPGKRSSGERRRRDLRMARAERAREAKQRRAPEARFANGAG